MEPDEVVKKLNIKNTGVKPKKTYTTGKGPGSQNRPQTLGSGFPTKSNKRK